MDRRHALRVCELITGIILTDQEYHPTEHRLLGRLFKRFGVPMGPKTMLTPTIDRAEAVRAMGALPAELRAEVLELLIEAAIVDGKVVPAEQEYLNAVAKAMGVDEQTVDDRLAQRLMAD